ncbi:MAG: hypothetical protein Q8L81_03910 [Bacteroidota bacterium]|nr:hypothetical protein [Bacteroidota bacterium]
MKKTKLILPAFTVMIAIAIAACHTTKKSSTTTETTSTPVATTTPTTTEPAKTSFSILSGSSAPGEQQVTAIQMRNPGTTLEQLTKGHSIYTGECAGCHRVFSVYDYTQEAWPAIIDRMALKAGITEGQKDALSRYIFAMKATQPTGK